MRSFFVALISILFVLGGSVSAEAAEPVVSSICADEPEDIGNFVVTDTWKSLGDVDPVYGVYRFRNRLFRKDWDVCCRGVVKVRDSLSGLPYYVDYIQTGANLYSGLYGRWSGWGYYDCDNCWKHWTQWSWAASYSYWRCKTWHYIFHSGYEYYQAKLKRRWR